MNSLLGLPPQVLVTAIGLVGLAILFLALFLGPGLLHYRRLGKVVKALRALPGSPTRLQVKQVFDVDAVLSHLWREYGESLHEQREEVDGQLAVSALRATLPAETFFNGQSIVDTRLRTEFFKHVPGMFTGIGIIGTFSGLISGLDKFEVSDDPEAVRFGLNALMEAVGEAFVVSAVAITAAILVTFVEKLLIAALYRFTEEISHEIDSRFEAGAGEEYLSRLVMASEESASQQRILKDALVQELRDVLRELTTAQIQAYKDHGAHLADKVEAAAARQIEASHNDSETSRLAITESIRDGLKGPMEQLAGVVKDAAGDQSASAVKMLQDVMANFSQKLNDLFGGQIAGINQLNSQAAQSMQAAVDQLQAVLAGMKSSGEQSTQEMANRMAAAIEKMELRQEAMNEQSRALVQSIKEQVSGGQSETQQRMTAALDAIGQQMTNLLTTLAVSQDRTFEANRTRESEMADRTREMVAELSRTVTTSLAAIESNSKMVADGLVANQGAAEMASQAREAQMSERAKLLTDSLAQSVQSSIESIDGRMRALSDTVNEVQVRSAAASQMREETFSDRAGEMVAKMSDTVTLAAKELAGASGVMSQSVASLSSTSRANIEKMNSGAETLNLVLQRFSAAGDKVSSVMGQAAMVSDSLVTASAQVSGGTIALQQVLKDYQAQRDSLAQVVSSVRETVELASREAAITKDVLARIESSAQRLAMAHVAADEYLAGVTNVLAKAHESFAAEVTRTLSVANTQFHDKMTLSVGLLSSSINELEATLGPLTPGRR